MHLNLSKCSRVVEYMTMHIDFGALNTTFESCFLPFETTKMYGNCLFGFDFINLV